MLRMRFLKTHCYIHHFLRTSVEARPACALQVVQRNPDQRWLGSKSGSMSDKKTKSVQLTSRITPHDLQIKIKKVSDLAQKGHMTRVAIKNLDPVDTKTPANLFKEFSSAVQEFASVNQSQSTATELVFVVKPKLASNEDTANESDKTALKPVKLHKSAKSETKKS